MDIAEMLKASGRLEDRKRRTDANGEFEGEGDGSGVSSAHLAAGGGNTLGQSPPRSFCGYAGIHNQGATCYLNSLLQALYCIPDLRRKFFEWKFEESVHGESRMCVTRQLQELFAELQLTARSAVFTGKLTKSFGWESSEASTQHDVTEALLIIVEAVQGECNGSPLQEAVKRMLCGTMEHYIACQGCGTVRTRKEEYLSVVLPLRGVKRGGNGDGGNETDIAAASSSSTTTTSTTTTTTTTPSTTPPSAAAAATPTPPDIGDALRELLVPEVLADSNAYACETCASKQTANKGVRLVASALPDVLCLQINRFDFDMTLMMRKKVLDPMSPLLELDMSKYTHLDDEKEATEQKPPIMYDLHAILMHLGGAMGGHYFAYIRTPPPPPPSSSSASTDTSTATPDGGVVSENSRWIEFNDSVITEIPAAQLARSLGQVPADQQSTPGSNGSAITPTAGENSATTSSTSSTVISPDTKQDSSNSNKTVDASTSAIATGTGKIHHSGLTGAYMLVYRRREQQPSSSSSSPQTQPTPSSVDIVPDTLIPIELRERIEAENAKYAAARAEYEEARRRVVTRVWYRASDVKDALQACGITTTSTTVHGGGGADAVAVPNTQSTSSTPASVSPFAPPYSSSAADTLLNVNVTLRDSESIEMVLHTAVSAIINTFTGNTSTASNSSASSSVTPKPVLSPLETEKLVAHFRVRHYDTMKKMSLSPVSLLQSNNAGEGSPNTLLSSNITTGKSLLLESRVDPVQQAWPEWVEGSLPLRVILLQQQQKQQQQQQGFSLGATTAMSSLQMVGNDIVTLTPGHFTVGDLREAAGPICARLLAQVSSSSSSSSSSSFSSPLKIRLLLLRQNIETPAIILRDDTRSLVATPSPPPSAAAAAAAAAAATATASSAASGGAKKDTLDPNTIGLRLAPGDTVHMEICGEDDPDPYTITNSPVASAWDQQVNMVRVLFNVPAGFAAVTPLPAYAEVDGDGKLGVSIDQRAPLSSLRELIATTLNVDGNTAFRMRRDPKGPEFKDGSQTLQYYALVSGGSSVWLQPGRPLTVDEHEFNIVLALPQESTTTATATATTATNVTAPVSPPVMSSGASGSAVVTPRPPMMSAMMRAADGGPPRPPAPGAGGPPRPPGPPGGLLPRPPAASAAAMPSPSSSSSMASLGSPSSNAPSSSLGAPQMKFIPLGTAVLKASALTTDAKKAIVEQLRAAALEKADFTLPEYTHIRIRERASTSSSKLNKLYVDARTLAENASANAGAKLGDSARELVLQITPEAEIATDDSLLVTPIRWRPMFGVIVTSSSSSSEEEKDGVTPSTSPKAITSTITRPFEWGTEILVSSLDTIAAVAEKCARVLKVSAAGTGVVEKGTPLASSTSVILARPHSFAVQEVGREPARTWTSLKWNYRVRIGGSGGSDEEGYDNNGGTGAGGDSGKASLSPTTTTAPVEVSNTQQEASSATTLTTASATTGTSISGTTSPASTSSSPTATPPPPTTTTASTTVDPYTTLVTAAPFTLRNGDLIMLATIDEYENPLAPGRPVISADGKPVAGTGATARAYPTARSGEQIFKIYTKEEQKEREAAKKEAEEARNASMPALPRPAMPCPPGGPTGSGPAVPRPPMPQILPPPSGR